MSQGISEQNINTGDMLRMKREQLGLSQQQVADLLDSSKSTISRWESGQLSNMGASKIKALSQILGISPIKIVMGEDHVTEEEMSTSEIVEYFQTNKKKLSSLNEEDSQRLIKLIDIYLD